MVYSMEIADRNQPSVVLFGYDSSPFTNKVRLALRIKQIPFSYVTVPSMMPRPLLQNTFGLSYRKIPILAIGREIYCDTSLIIEALEHFFPTSAGYNTIYPPATSPSPSSQTSWNYRPLARGFASFWTDRPLFRTTTGLIPHTVWESRFGTDRAQLIGHKLDPAKLRAKVPQNLAALDLHLSLLEPLFANAGNAEGGKRGWVFPTKTPSLGDVSLYYQIRWGVDIAAGKGVYNLTGGGAAETAIEVTASVWNAERYPGLWTWLHAFEEHIASLPDPEIVVPGGDEGWKEKLREADSCMDENLLVPAAAAPHGNMDAQLGLVPGVTVSVAPDDTGRGDPTVGRLVRLGIEEVVIEPDREGELKVRVHFPRLGFVVKATEGQKAKL